jgi:hypothetical protein
VTDDRGPQAEEHELEDGPVEVNVEDNVEDNLEDGLEDGLEVNVEGHLEEGTR